MWNVVVMANARVQRGRKTQEIAAEHLRSIFPDVRSNPASLKGKDLLDTPAWAFEVKARRDFNPSAWIKQAGRNADSSEYPAVIMRPDGYGEAKVAEWLVFMTLGDFRILLNEIHSLRSR